VPAFSIAAWDGAQWGVLGSDLETPTSTFALVDGALYGGGGFWCEAGQEYSAVGRWTGSVWEALTPPPSNLPFQFPANPAMVDVGGQLVAADGAFIATWDGSAWTTIGTAPGGIAALANYGGNLVAGGPFATVSGVAAAKIARRRGSVWEPMGDGFSAPANAASVRAVIAYSQDLIAAGYFTSSGATPVSRIARWDGSSWQPLGAGCDGWINCLTVYRSDLIVGGSFSSAGGTPAANIARWDGASWSALGSGADNAVWALTVHDGDLVAGGDFTTAGGLPAVGLARWDGSGWHAIPGSPQAPGRGSFSNRALASFNGDLFVGGSFTAAGTVGAYGWARLGCACYANCDGSTVPPILNVTDLICFQQRFAEGDSYANCDGSTAPPMLNAADFVCFMQRFVAGCP
jgi:hypothetical protein